MTARGDGRAAGRYSWAVKLQTHVVEKPWGRTDLPPVFEGTDGRQIGEVWFDRPGADLPILVKWLFTSEKLSVQVHPDDAQAKTRGMASGKEECWVIVSAEPDARLGMGTIKPLSAAELRAASISGEIEQLMDWKPVAAGDYFYIPAGTVHAIGAGITLVEVQQNADITYRLYDYGRPRELHLEDGVAVSRARPYDDVRSGRIGGDIGGDDVQALVAGPHFNLWHVRGDAVADLVAGDGRCWIIPLSGTVQVEDGGIGVGECALLPGGAKVTAPAGAAVLIARETHP